MNLAKNLTHSAIQGARPKGKPYKLSDTGRLYVLVTAAGKKYWKWNYRLDGKDCTYKFGTFPDLGLAEARELRGAAEKLVAKGIHPADFDKEQRLKAKSEKDATFWSVAEEWISANAVKWSAYYLSQVQSFMHRYVRDTAFGARPISKITTAEIYDLVTGVARRDGVRGDERKATGAPTVAYMLRQWCGAVFRLAIMSGRAERNPVSDLKASDAIVRAPVKSNRELSPTEIQDLQKSLKAFKGQRITGIALELMMLTFLRTVELRGATWEEIDFENAVWTVPAERMKKKGVGDHMVPLSRQSLELLKELKEITGGLQSRPHWLFPNTRRASACMNPSTLIRALERMGFNGQDTIGFSPHGFRGTASTLLHEMQCFPLAIEVQLAHLEKSQSKRAYNKAKYIRARKPMMQLWANYLDDLAKGETALPFAGAEFMGGDAIAI